MASAGGTTTVRLPLSQSLLTPSIKKLLAWRPGDPSYAGTPWLVKNHLEFKNGQRALVEGNLFEDHWAGGQSGFFLMLTPRVESGANPWAVASDITFRHNWVRRTTAAWGQ